MIETVDGCVACRRRIVCGRRVIEADAEAISAYFRTF